MSPVLRKASPRVTSEATSAADSRRLGGGCVGGGEVVSDEAGGVACSSAGGGEATKGGASASGVVWPRAATAGIAGWPAESSTGATAASGGGGCGIVLAATIAALDDWSEMFPRHSASAGNRLNLPAASGASCPDKAMVPERTDGPPIIATS